MDNLKDNMLKIPEGNDIQEIQPDENENKQSTLQHIWSGLKSSFNAGLDEADAMSDKAFSDGITVMDTMMGTTAIAINRETKEQKDARIKYFQKSYEENKKAMQLEVKNREENLNQIHNKGVRVVAGMGLDLVQYMANPINLVGEIVGGELIEPLTKIGRIGRFASKNFVSKAAVRSALQGIPGTVVSAVDERYQHELLGKDESSLPQLYLENSLTMFGMENFGHFVASPILKASSTSRFVGKHVVDNVFNKDGEHAAKNAKDFIENVGASEATDDLKDGIDSVTFDQDKHEKQEVAAEMTADENSASEPASVVNTDQIEEFDVKNNLVDSEMEPSEDNVNAILDNRTPEPEEKNVFQIADEINNGSEPSEVETSYIEDSEMDEKVDKAFAELEESWDPQNEDDIIDNSELGDLAAKLDKEDINPDEAFAEVEKKFDKPNVNRRDVNKIIHTAVNTSLKDLSKLKEGSTRNTAVGVAGTTSSMAEDEMIKGGFKGTGVIGINLKKDGTLIIRTERGQTFSKAQSHYIKKLVKTGVVKDSNIIVDNVDTGLSLDELHYMAGTAFFAFSLTAFLCSFIELLNSPLFFLPIEAVEPKVEIGKGGKVTVKVSHKSEATRPFFTNSKVEINDAISKAKGEMKANGKKTKAYRDAKKTINIAQKELDFRAGKKNKGEFSNSIKEHKKAVKEKAKKAVPKVVVKAEPKIAITPETEAPEKIIKKVKEGIEVKKKAVKKVKVAEETIQKAEKEIEAKTNTMREVRAEIKKANKNSAKFKKGSEKFKKNAENLKNLKETLEKIKEQKAADKVKKTLAETEKKKETAKVKEATKAIEEVKVTEEKKVVLKKEAKVAEKEIKKATEEKKKTDTKRKKKVDTVESIGKEIEKVKEYRKKLHEGSKKFESSKQKLEELSSRLEDLKEKESTPKKESKETKEVTEESLDDLFSDVKNEIETEEKEAEEAYKEAIKEKEDKIKEADEAAVVEATPGIKTIKRKTPRTKTAKKGSKVKADEVVIISSSTERKPSLDSRPFHNIKRTDLIEMIKEAAIYAESTIEDSKEGKKAQYLLKAYKRELEIRLKNDAGAYGGRKAKKNKVVWTSEKGEIINKQTTLQEALDEKVGVKKVNTKNEAKPVVKKKVKSSKAIDITDEENKAVEEVKALAAPEKKISEEEQTIQKEMEDEKIKQDAVDSYANEDPNRLLAAIETATDMMNNSEEGSPDYIRGQQTYDILFKALDKITKSEKEMLISNDVEDIIKKVSQIETDTNKIKIIYKAAGKDVNPKAVLDETLDVYKARENYEEKKKAYEDAETPVHERPIEKMDVQKIREAAPKIKALKEHIALKAKEIGEDAAKFEREIAEETDANVRKNKTVSFTFRKEEVKKQMKALVDEVSEIYNKSNPGKANSGKFITAVNRAIKKVGFLPGELDSKVMKLKDGTELHLMKDEVTGLYSLYSKVTEKGPNFEGFDFHGLIYQVVQHLPSNEEKEAKEFAVMSMGLVEDEITGIVLENDTKVKARAKYELDKANQEKLKEEMSKAKLDYINAQKKQVEDLVPEGAKPLTTPGSKAESTPKKAPIVRTYNPLRSKGYKDVFTKERAEVVSRLEAKGSQWKRSLINKFMSMSTGDKIRYVAQRGLETEALQKLTGEGIFNIIQGLHVREGKYIIDPKTQKYRIMTPNELNLVEPIEAEIMRIYLDNVDTETGILKLSKENRGNNAGSKINTEQTLEETQIDQNGETVTIKKQGTKNTVVKTEKNKRKSYKNLNWGIASLTDKIMKLHTYGHLGYGQYNIDADFIHDLSLLDYRPDGTVYDSTLKRRRAATKKEVKTFQGINNIVDKVYENNLTKNGKLQYVQNKTESVSPFKTYLEKEKEANIETTNDNVDFIRMMIGSFLEHGTEEAKGIAEDLMERLDKAEGMMPDDTKEKLTAKKKEKNKSEVLKAAEAEIKKLKQQIKENETVDRVDNKDAKENAKSESSARNNNKLIKPEDYQLIIQGVVDELKKNFDTYNREINDVNVNEYIKTNLEDQGIKSKTDVDPSNPNLDDLAEPGEKQRPLGYVIDENDGTVKNFGFVTNVLVNNMRIADFTKIIKDNILKIADRRREVIHENNVINRDKRIEEVETGKVISEKKYKKFKFHDLMEIRSVVLDIMSSRETYFKQGLGELVNNAKQTLGIGDLTELNNTAASVKQAFLKGYSDDSKLNTVMKDLVGFFDRRSSETSSVNVDNKTIKTLLEKFPEMFKRITDENGKVKLLLDKFGNVQLDTSSKHFEDYMYGIKEREEKGVTSEIKNKTVAFGTKHELSNTELTKLDLLAHNALSSEDGKIFANSKVGGGLSKRTVDRIKNIKAKVDKTKYIQRLEQITNKQSILTLLRHINVENGKRVISDDVLPELAEKYEKYFMTDSEQPFKRVFAAFLDELNKTRNPIAGIESETYIPFNELEAYFQNTEQMGGFFSAEENALDDANVMANVITHIADDAADQLVFGKSKLDHYNSLSYESLTHELALGEYTTAYKAVAEQFRREQQRLMERTFHTLKPREIGDNTNRLSNTAFRLLKAYKSQIMFGTGLIEPVTDRYFVAHRISNYGNLLQTVGNYLQATMELPSGIVESLNLVRKLAVNTLRETVNADWKRMKDVKSLEGLVNKVFNSEKLRKDYGLSKSEKLIFGEHAYREIENALGKTKNITPLQFFERIGYAGQKLSEMSRHSYVRKKVSAFVNKMTPGEMEKNPRAKILAERLGMDTPEKRAAMLDKIKEFTKKKQVDVEALLNDTSPISYAAAAYHESLIREIREPNSYLFKNSDSGFQKFSEELKGMFKTFSMGVAIDDIKSLFYKLNDDGSYESIGHGILSGPGGIKSITNSSARMLLYGIFTSTGLLAANELKEFYSQNETIDEQSARIAAEAETTIAKFRREPVKTAGEFLFNAVETSLVNITTNMTGGLRFSKPSSAVLNILSGYLTAPRKVTLFFRGLENNIKEMTDHDIFKNEYELNPTDNKLAYALQKMFGNKIMTTKKRMSDETRIAYRETLGKLKHHTILLNHKSEMANRGNFDEHKSKVIDIYTRPNEDDALLHSKILSYTNGKGILEGREIIDFKDFSRKVDELDKMENLTPEQEQTLYNILQFTKPQYADRVAINFAHDMHMGYSVDTVINDYVGSGQLKQFLEFSKRTDGDYKEKSKLAESTLKFKKRDSAIANAKLVAENELMKKQIDGLSEATMNELLAKKKAEALEYAHKKANENINGLRIMKGRGIGMSDDDIKKMLSEDDYNDGMEYINRQQIKQFQTPDYESSDKNFEGLPDQTQPEFSGHQSSGSGTSGTNATPGNAFPGQREDENMFGDVETKPEDRVKANLGDDNVTPLAVADSLLTEEEKADNNKYTIRNAPVDLNIKYTKNSRAQTAMVSLMPTINEVAKEYGIDPAIAAAQISQETGWLSSRVGKHNIFGRKWVKSDGIKNRQVITTHETKKSMFPKEFRGSVKYDSNSKKYIGKAYFRKYKSDKEAIESYVALIKKYYTTNGKLDLVKLKKYASDTEYVKHILTRARQFRGSLL